MVLCTYLVYNTVVRLCNFICCGGKINFVRIPYSHDRFSKISRTFFVKKLNRKKKFSSSVWRVLLLCQFLVLAGNRQFFCCGGKVLLRPEKKVLPYNPGHKNHLKDKVQRSKSFLFSYRVKCQECMGTT